MTLRLRKACFLLLKLKSSFNILFFKGAWGNFWRWYTCLLAWFWWWFHGVTEWKSWHLCLHIISVPFAAYSLGQKTSVTPCSPACRHVNHQKEFGLWFEINATSPLPKPHILEEIKNNVKKRTSELSRTCRNIMAKPMTAKWLESANQGWGVSPLSSDPCWHPDIWVDCHLLTSTPPFLLFPKIKKLEVNPKVRWFFRTLICHLLSLLAV